MSWHVSSIRDRDGYTQIVDHNGDVVASVEWEADAAILAAAPELLEAVERLLYVMTPEANDPFAWNGAIDAGEAAIEKARGSERKGTA